MHHPFTRPEVSAPTANDICNTASPALLCTGFSFSNAFESWDSHDPGDGYVDCAVAHAYYVGHRSGEASLSAKVIEMTHESGEPAGFVAYRIQEEEDRASRRFFISLDYVYVKPKFRRQRVAASLLNAVLFDFEKKLLSPKPLRPGKHVFCASDAERGVEKQLSESFERDLFYRIHRRPGVKFHGRFV